MSRKIEKSHANNSTKPSKQYGPNCNFKTLFPAGPTTKPKMFQGSSHWEGDISAKWRTIGQITPVKEHRPKYPKHCMDCANWQPSSHGR